MATEKWLTDYGLSKDKIIGRSHYEIFPEIPDDWKDLHQRTLKGETLSADADPFLRADGHLDWVKWKNVPWFQKDGSIGGMIMFTEVITDQVLMAKAMENAVGSVSRIDANGKYDFVNSEYADIFGTTPADLLATPFTSSFDEGEIAKLNDGLDRLHDQSKTVVDLEAQRSDDTEFDLQATLVANSDRGGQTAGFYCFGKDITTENQVREESFRQTEWLKMTQSMGNIGHWFIDFKEEKIFWSDQVFRIHGLDPATSEEPALEDAIAFYHPDDRETVSQLLDEAIANKTGFDFELRLIRPSGEQRWVTSTGECRLDEDGEVAALFGVFKDFTDIQSKNEEILRIKERSEVAMHGASVGLWEIDPETQEAHWSSLIDEILGTPDGQSLTRSEIFRRVLDEDKDGILEYPERLLNDADDGEITIRMHHNDGEIVYVQLRGNTIHDDAGNIKSLAGSFTDITQEKQADALRGELWDILIVQDLSMNEKFDHILKKGSEYLDLEIGIISKIDGDEYCVEHVHTPDGTLQRDDTFDFLHTYCHNVYTANGPQAFNSVGTSKIRHHPCYETFQLEAYVGAPIFVSGRRYGTVNFSSPEKRDRKFSSTELQIIEQLSQWVGYEIDRSISTQSLKASQERFATAVRGASVGIWDWKNVNQQDAYWSDHLYGLLGYHPSEIDATMANFLLLIHPADREKFQNALKLHLERQIPLNMELRLKQKSNSYRWFLGTGQAIWDKDGQAQRIIGSIMDINARKHADVMKSEFVSTVSHELRTPMTSIMGSIGLVRSGNFGELNPKAQILLDIALKNGGRLVRLINDILDIEKIEAGKMEFVFRQESISDIIEDTVTESQAFVDKFGSEINFVDESDGANVKGDRDRLIQVFTNLISNAAKFSGENGKIVVTTSASAEDVTITVTDNGEGIPPENLPTIFEKFIQVDGSDNRTAQGTGLGLSISKAIVSAHSGTITVDSEVGTGSTFTVTLQRLTESERSGTNKDANSDGDSLGTILHVEDDDDVAEIISHLVSDHAHFLTSDTVYSAWKQLNSSKVDLVLLDMQLHNTRGEELIDLIDRELDYKPAVMIYSVEESLADSFPNFVVDRFVKSKVSNDVILKKIKSVLHHSGSKERMTGT